MPCLRFICNITTLHADLENIELPKNANHNLTIRHRAEFSRLHKIYVLDIFHIIKYDFKHQRLDQIKVYKVSNNLVLTR